MPVGVRRRSGSATHDRPCPDCGPSWRSSGTRYGRASSGGSNCRICSAADFRPHPRMRLGSRSIRLPSAGSRVRVLNNLEANIVGEVEVADPHDRDLIRSEYKLDVPEPLVLVVNRDHVCVAQDFVVDEIHQVDAVKPECALVVLMLGDGPDGVPLRDLVVLFLEILPHNLGEVVLHGDIEILVVDDLLVLVHLFLRGLCLGLCRLSRSFYSLLLRLLLLALQVLYGKKCRRETDDERR
uniref:Uncharacterized protein n=1 Tax=Siphovirus contig89 TaxID=1518022 RepID=A0A075EHP8_9CAUD|nr:hypothetical protein [Siphovirus contig89]AIE38408.1 hypothetical protein [Siphovirus contig89]AIE38451.1 hypothetical protein [Siphovirus contig89]AIE38494.1 hypothetical protein [Siphovirus contig89]AIE38537.1 hypothetical protein [Siphovirus contig89]